MRIAAASGTKAAALLAARRTGFARAQKIPPTDARRETAFVELASPAGCGNARAYVARPAAASGPLPVASSCTTPRTEPAQLGAIGFRYGGGMVDFLATRMPLLAGAPFYGAPAPLDQLDRIEAELVLAFAENDERIHRHGPPTRRRWSARASSTRRRPTPARSTA